MFGLPGRAFSSRHTKGDTFPFLSLDAPLPRANIV